MLKTTVTLKYVKKNQFFAVFSSLFANMYPELMFVLSELKSS